MSTITVRAESAHAPSSPPHICRRYSSGGLVCVTALLAVCLFAAGARAADGVVRVEEDWVVEVDEPDADGNAPQIFNALSTTDKLADVHALFELNHRTLPSYRAGRMQLQIWSGDVNLAYSNGPTSGVLATPGEVVQYTMGMRVAGGNVEFEVLKGSSTTWGSFGGQGYLKNTVSTPQSDLSLYSPETSVANSRVGFGGNRVKKFALKEVRYYAQNGDLVKTDATERVVHKK